MKKSRLKPPVRHAQPKTKTKVKRAARRAGRMTESAAARALADLKAAIAALKRTSRSASSVQKVKQAFGLATKLNHLVKRMKSAHVI